MSWLIVTLSDECRRQVVFRHELTGFGEGNPNPEAAARLMSEIDDALDAGAPSGALQRDLTHEAQWRRPLSYIGEDTAYDFADIREAVSGGGRRWRPAGFAQFTMVPGAYDDTAYINFRDPFNRERPIEENAYTELGCGSGVQVGMSRSGEIIHLEILGATRWLHASLIDR